MDDNFMDKWKVDHREVQNNLPQRAGFFSSPSSQTAQASEINSTEQSRRLRKQWYQQNDLNYYNKSILAEEIKNGSGHIFPNQEYVALQSGNFSDSLNEQSVQRNKNPNDLGNILNQNTRDVDRMDQGTPDHRKPSWLMDEESFTMDTNSGNMTKDNFQDATKETVKIPDWLQQDQPGYPDPNPVRNEKLSQPISDRTNTPSQQILHRRFSSNPVLSLKSPYANDYVQGGTLMSESASAFLRNHDAGPNGNQDQHNMIGRNVFERNNRSRCHGPESSEMSKLLSFAYIADRNGSGDGVDRIRSGRTRFGSFDRGNSAYGTLLEKKESPKIGEPNNAVYKPTCVERLNTDIEYPTDDYSSDSFKTDVEKYQKADRPAFNKKKFSFDEGRPSFFLNLHKSESLTESTGNAQPPHKETFTNPNHPSQNIQTDFRRRRMNINGPVTPGPIKPR